MDIRPTLSRLRKLLATRDPSDAAQAVEIAVSLDDPALYDVLLKGVRFETRTVNSQTFGAIAAGEFFTADTKVGQRLHDEALRLLLSRVPDTCEPAKALRATITHLSLHATEVYPYQPLDLTPLAAFTALQQLHLRSISVLTGLESLAALPHLEVLHFASGNLPEGAQGLAGSPSLRVLHLGGAVPKIGDLGEMPSLRELEIPYASQLQSLDGVERLKAITSLTAMGSLHLPSLDPLAKITTLQKLKLQTGHEIPSLRALAGNTGLEALELYAPLRSLEGAEAMRTLQSLHLTGGPSLTSLAPLTGLTTLRSLKLSNTGVETLDGLEACDLTDIALYPSPNLRCVKGLRGTRGLREIRWILPALQSLDGLENLASLEHLRLTAPRKLTSLAALRGSKTLRTIELEDAEALASLAGLEGCVALESLRITRATALTDLAALAGLPSLKTVHLLNCPALTDITALAALPALEILDLSGAAALADVAPLAKVTSLKALGLAATAVERAKIDERVRKITTFAADRDLAALAARGPIERHGPHVPEAITRDIKKHYQQLKKLLLARDTTLVDQGVELAVSLGEVGIFNGLLDGVTYEKNLRRASYHVEGGGTPGGMFKPNEVFEVTGPAAPYRDRALLGLMFHAPEGCTTAHALRAEVTRLELDGTTASRKRTPVDLAPLTMFSKLTELTVTSAETLEHPETLGALTGLEYLSFLYSSVGSLKDLRGHPSLKSLYSMSHWSAAGRVLEGLENMPKLASVVISGGAMPGTSALQNLPALTTFRARGMQQLDELHFRGCPRLTTLELTSAQSLRVLDITGCAELTELTVNYCPSIQSLRGLRGLAKLRNLVVTSATALPLTVAELEGLDGLRSLTLTSCAGLKDVAVLAGIGSLERLQLSYCANLEDVSALAALPNLRVLDLQGCQKLKDLSALAGMTQLKQLMLRHSGVDPKALTGRLAKIAR